MAADDQRHAQVRADAIALDHVLRHPFIAAGLGHGHGHAITHDQLTERDLAIGGLDRGQVGGQPVMRAEQLDPLEHQRHRRDRRVGGGGGLADQGLQHRILIGREQVSRERRKPRGVGGENVETLHVVSVAVPPP